MNIIRKIFCIIVKSKRFRENPKQFIYNKRVSKGRDGESILNPFFERLDNPKGALAYNNISIMSKEKNFVSEIAVSYSPTYKRKIKITDAYSAEKTLRKMWDAQLMNIQEQFCVLFLNNANEVVGFRCLSTGGLTATSVDLRILFSIACKSLSSSIIIAHNHPSGSLKASKADIDLTHKIKRAGDMLDITLHDHLILTQKSFVSLAQQGVI